MTNKEIATVFNDLAKIMELHQENKFKIRSYANAYLTLRKLDQPLTDMSEEDLSGIKGVGKAISAKIREYIDTGTLETLKKYQDKTPLGVQEMLKIKGFGPKKVYEVWTKLGSESVGELLYACNENRLIELKGFGKKTQEDLIQKLEYFQKSKHQFHYASLEQEAQQLLTYIKEKLPDAKVHLTGAIRRLAPTLSAIEILVALPTSIDSIFKEEILVLQQEDKGHYIAHSKQETPVILYHCSPEEYGSKLFLTTATTTFRDAFIAQQPNTSFKGIATEAEIFKKAKLPEILPELREDAYSLTLATKNELPTLIEKSDIKGVLHAHSTYSDGIASLKDMATECQRLGYEYLGITDHSKSAFYANGLKVDRLQAQWEEINQLNASFKDGFKIFKGIESDILSDGSLDYEKDILKQFDFIIASVHSNLKMDEQKATTRLIKAIENPYTTILGHPTGRLLLSRKGYPIDYQKVIDACAANGVAIELNANPYRLDLDYQWIPYAIEKGVSIAINPDAHSKEGIQDLHFGVLAARKGYLEKSHCLNSKSLSEFEKWLKKE